MRRFGWLVLVAALAIALAACGDDEEAGGPAGEEATVLDFTVREITEPESGQPIGGNVVTLDFEVRGVRIVKADGDTSGETGHFHVFVDRDPVAPGEVVPREPGIIHTTEDPLVIPGLSVGGHRITAVLGDGAHRRIPAEGGEVGTTVNMAGPSIQAEAPAAVAAGAPVTVTMAVEGVRIVKADGDTSGETGHFHVLVDAPPPIPLPSPPVPFPAGREEIIHTTETSVEIRDLAAGEHTIWVVLGDGNHVPFDPLVADKVTVTVQ